MDNEDKGQCKEFSTYTLPLMPTDIAADLRNVTEDVPDSLRKKIIEWIAYNFSSRTI